MNDVCNSNETVREVCAEMQLQTYQSAFRASDVIGWRERILAAHEREMAARDADIERLTVAHNAQIDTMESRIAEMVEIVAAKDAEIARLKAAMKPVMECDLTDVDASLNCILMSSHNAVREAQRIVGAWDDKNYFEKGEKK